MSATFFSPEALKEDRKGDDLREPTTGGVGLRTPGYIAKRAGRFMHMLPYVAVLVLLAFNIYAYFLMGSDKKRAAEGRFRVSEKKLLLVALFGGSLGIYRGMKKYRHKTKHFLFSFGVPAIIVLQGCLLGYCAYRYAMG